MSASVFKGEAAAGPAAGEGQPLGKRILLVDDQDAVRQAISLLLSLDNHEVVEAGDGEKALELYKQGRFDLVMTDFEMPNMRGDQLAARIKQLCPSQPILMITAYAELVDPAHQAIDAALDKPFMLDDLRQVMARLLR